MEHTKLIKGNVEDHFDTLVFVGNGAINNGFLPLRNALDKWINNDPNTPLVKKLRSRNDEAYHQLAVISYKFRFFRAVLNNKFFRDPLKCDESEISKFIQSTTTIRGFLDLRKSISNEFNNANNLTLRSDSEIQSLIGKNSLFITTNWDNVLWNDTSVMNLIHLHGRASWDQSVVFPTELLVEDITFDLAPCINPIRSFQLPNLTLIKDIFRQDSLEALFNLVQITSLHLQRTKRIVLWGYSLGDYDADINSILGTWNQNLTDRELWVINPDLNVLKRSIALTGCENANLYDPVSKVKHQIHDI